ncbi:MAG: 4Fe-4S binding protein, partial [Bacteroidales bacterium]|nr:4Fe-4S binding protein [Bacteroidales bacterium]
MRSRMGIRKRMGGGGHGMGKGRGAVRGTGGSGRFIRSGNGIVTDFLNLGKDLVNGIIGSQRLNSPLITNNMPDQMNRQITGGAVNKVSIVAVVDPDKCTGCDDCSEVCPVDVVSSFDEKITTRKAIYIEFPQAVPI